MRRNARFWVWWNDSWVKLTLTPARPVVQFGHGGPTDEGYSSNYERYELCEDRVECEMASCGRDCDGPHEWHWLGYCLLDELQVPFECATVLDGQFDPGVRCNWHRQSSYQRDVYAEMAGY